MTRRPSLRSLVRDTTTEEDGDFGPEVGGFLDFAVDRYAIDESRIYLTGISCGAIGAWDYLAQQDDPVVAAVVPISGHPDWAMEKAGCAVLRTAIWDFQRGS